MFAYDVELACLSQVDPNRDVSGQFSNQRSEHHSDALPDPAKLSHPLKEHYAAHLTVTSCGCFEIPMHFLKCLNTELPLSGAQGVLQISEVEVLLRLPEDRQGVWFLVKTHDNVLFVRVAQAENPS
jgi:hypothetical protein